MNEPNNPGQGDNCVEVKDGLWRDDLCQIEKNFICEAAENDATIVTDAFWSPCPEDWVLVKKKCYRLENVTMSFADAKDFCNNINSKLFEPTYLAEDAAVRQHFGTPMSFWLGFTDSANEGL